MRQGRSKLAGWLTALFCVGGAVLVASPESIAATLRSHLRDLLQPGQRVAVDFEQRAQKWFDRPAADPKLAAELQETRQRLAAAELREQTLLVRTAKLQEQIDQLQGTLRIPTTKDRSEPLVLHNLLATNVLSRDTVDRLRHDVTLSAGEQDDIDPAAYVLDGEQPLIDQGEDAGIAAGQNVYAARNVVGRVAGVGRWTSSLRLITDPEYRALARLARLTEGGMIWSAAGRLEGDGDGHCLLRSIDATQLVSLGDLVFTAGGDGGVPQPMLYGRVVEAELRPGAVEWHIRIEPAADLSALRTVHVLRQTINPLRMSAQ